MVMWLVPDKSYLLRYVARFFFLKTEQRVMKERCSTGLSLMGNVVLSEGNGVLSED